jgi:hypothetical protein
VIVKKPSKTDKRTRKQPVDDAKLREIRGGDGGITANDDWETPIV